LAVARADVMSIGCDLKKNYGGVSIPKLSAFGWP
jgi:hypothetical protein